MSEEDKLSLGSVSGSLGIGSEHQSTPLVATNSENQEFAKINNKYFDLPKEEKEVFLIKIIQWASSELSNYHNINL